MSEPSRMESNRTNELLGYPLDARLLIINADDFGRYHGVNEAIFRTLKEGVVRSTTLMVPGPGAEHAMQLLEENPNIAFGVHLTVVCDVHKDRWGPLAPRDIVRSLLDETGDFYSWERIPELLAKAKLDELETEFRAQIESVLSANLKPTHLDWHCLYDGGSPDLGGRPDIFDLTFVLAREFGLAIRSMGRQSREKVQSQGLPVNDHEVVDSYRLETAGKSEIYAQKLRDLPPGLIEWAVHPGLGDAEAQTMDPAGWQVRFADYEFLISQQAKDTIESEGIILLSYRELQEVWKVS
jgi:chitin disaccharide deacetylase